jgi:alpha-glucan,water dikinase
VVGAKAHVLADLRRRLPDWIQVPSSIALGFGTFERVLESEVNAGVNARLTALLREAESAPEVTLARIRETMLALRSPEPLAQQMIEAAKTEGLPSLEPFEVSWRAICAVWGSKWTDRAHFARVARGIPSDQVFMSVLIQEVVQADYAFVLHTNNPQNGNPNELYGELVLGLGEALVGNYPGRALGFVANKVSGELRIESYPSKSVVLRAKGLIFRSDSNAEDLEGFAGAGLHDTVTAAPARRETADYSRERLVCEPQFRSNLLARVVRVGIELERVLGTAQDVEGVVAGDRVVVVQSRPQVGL